MAKKDTFLALVRRGIDEETAKKWGIAEGYDIDESYKKADQESQPHYGPGGGNAERFAVHGLKLGEVASHF